MGSRGPKLCDVLVTIATGRGSQTLEFYNVPEADVTVLRKKWGDRRRKRGQKFKLVPVDGKNTGVKSLKVDTITDIKTTPC